MNRQLESLFDLPPAESFKTETPPDTELVESLDPVPEASLFDRIEQALPQVHGLRSGENEVDHIADEAMKSYQEIKDLALNVEPRFSSELLAVAAALLKTALDAKQGKTEAKLKSIRLQLQALRAQQDAAQSQNGITQTQGKIVGDRNQLIAAMKKPPSGS